MVTEENDDKGVKLNSKLADKFAEAIENTINKVCEDCEEDPRLELLVTLTMFAAQLSVEIGWEEDSFLSLASDMYNWQDEGEEKEAEVETDPRNIN